MERKSDDEADDTPLDELPDRDALRRLFPPEVAEEVERLDEDEEPDA